MLENLAREKLSYRKVDSLDKSGRSSEEKGLSAKSAPCFSITKIAARYKQKTITVPQVSTHASKLALAATSQLHG